jgi:hypothetical protein
VHLQCVRRATDMPWPMLLPGLLVI